MSYPAYPEYKDSGVEWLGEVPAHWDVTTGKRLFSNRKDRALQDDKQLSATQKYGVVPQNLFMESEQQKVTLALSGISSFRHVEVGDFVISLRSFQGGIEISDHSGCVSPAYTVMKPANKVDGSYFKHLLKSYGFISILNVVSDGIRDGKTISYDQFSSVAFPVPPKEEQLLVATFLDQETARIDALVEEQQRLIALLKEKRQAVTSHAVTKGLDSNVPMKDSGVEWLGEVPEHWICKRYRHATRIYRGKFGHRPRNDPSLYDGDFPFIQTGDIARADKKITNYTQTLNEKGAAVSQKFPSGSLVMAIAANIGDTAILDFEAFAPDSVVAFEPAAGVKLEFLRYSLNAALPALEKTSTQSTQANLNIDRVGAVEAVFPPAEEQNRIVKFLDRTLHSVSNLEGEVSKGLQLLQERRSALISAAVTGKIDVRGWQAAREADPSKMLMAAEERATYG